MKTHYRLDVKLTLEGPILTSGGEMSDPGVDSPMAKDRNGNFMLPFSLIKGKVLDALRDLGTESAFRRTWLGLENADGSFDPERGRLCFSDFHTEQPGTPDNVIERIQIDSETGSTGKGMLLMMQAPFGYGEEVTFQGTISFIADQDEAKEVNEKLTPALRWVPAYGANRTIGFGRTKRVETSLESQQPRPSNRPPPSNNLLPWRLKLDRPLCVVGRKHSRNHFESQEVISGAVLKGAMANLLLSVTGSSERNVSDKIQGAFPKLCERFEQVRFSEARPMRNDSAAKRPIEPPLSIVVSPTREREFFDVAFWDAPGLIGDAAPAFLPDWKDADFGLVRSHFGWPQLPKERRTRTAINSQTGRAADEQLFSYGLVLPNRKTEAGHEESFVWEGNIGLEAVPEADQAAIRSQLQQLLQYGLPAIGKTRAIATVDWLADPTPPAIESANGSNGLVAITLQTECLMTNPDLLTDGQASTLKRAYNDFWNEVSGGALELERYFARQSLYGGYVSRRANAEKYQPFLLTDRGSIFILKPVKPNDVPSCLAQWQQAGLPVPGWVSNRYGRDQKPLWQCCPYLPQNGYGEIAVNLECHTTHSADSTPDASKEIA